MLSATAQRYLKMIADAKLAEERKKEEAAAAAVAVVSQHRVEKAVVSQHRVEETVVWENRDELRFLPENSRLEEEFRFADSKDRFAETSAANFFNRSCDSNFPIFQIQKASMSHENQRSSFTYTVADESSVADHTNTEVLFGNSTVGGNSNVFTAAEESYNELPMKLQKPSQSLFFPWNSRSKQPADKPYIRPLPKRNCVDPSSSDIINGRINASMTETEVLFKTQTAVSFGDQTCQTEFDTDTSANGQLEDVLMTDCEATFNEEAEDSDFDAPIRVRENFFENCYKQKQKIHFSTYFQSPKEVKVEVPDPAELSYQENEEDFEAITKGMLTLQYTNVDGLDSMGNVNESFTFGSSSSDEDDDINDIDMEDEDSLKNQRLNSSTPQKKTPKVSFSAISFKQPVASSTIREETPEEVVQADQASSNSAANLSENQRLEKRLTQSNRETPPKLTIPEPSHLSHFDASKKQSVPAEHLSDTVRQLCFGRSPLKSRVVDELALTDNFAAKEFEKILIDEAKEIPAPANDSQNNFRGFTSQQRTSLHNIDQELIKEILIEDETPSNEKNIETLQKIENIFKSLLEPMAQGKPMTLKVPSVRNWKDCTMSQNVLSQRESNPVKTISQSNKHSERTFAVNVAVLSECYKLLAKNTTCTKREIYYRDVDMFRNQNSVNSAIDSICAMLDVQEFELGVMTSSKGLVAGDLVIKVGEDVTDCTNQCSVPQNPSAITSLESTADYVLVVEKDTVFQRLVSERIFSRIDAKIILVTAKGYPDVNTRVFLKKIADDLKLPIYILVDADPHGIEIMMTYKYGSMHKIHNSQYLAVPSLQWIGFYPTDLVREDALTLEVTKKDLKKIDELLERPYVDALLKRELNCFKTSLKKAEIESLYNFSINNLINDYIPRKIRSLETTLHNFQEF